MLRCCIECGLGKYSTHSMNKELPFRRTPLIIEHVKFLHNPRKINYVFNFSHDKPDKAIELLPSIAIPSKIQSDID